MPGQSLPGRRRRHPTVVTNQDGLVDGHWRNILPQRCWPEGGRFQEVQEMRYLCMSAVSIAAARGICLLLLLLLTPIALQANEPLAGLPWSYSGPPDKEPVARQVVEALLRRCPRIGQAMPDFASFEAEYRRLQPFDSRYRAGYRVLVEGGPVLADARARIMPSPPFIPGDHALFEVLGLPRPGVAMDKAVALWLCDAPIPEAGDVTFILTPESAFIER